MAKRIGVKKLLLLSCIILSSPSLAVEINLGEASKYNAFIKNNLKVKASDTQGRVAIGGDFIVEGGNDIGYRIGEFGMGDGPSLVVGGDVIKTGPGSINVYEPGVHQTPHSGEMVYGGTVYNNGEIVTETINGKIEATFNKKEINQLPVDFDDAFAHLNQLSENLMATTAHGEGIKDGWPLVFTPTSTPDDNVYVFNVLQEQINSTNEWRIEGVSSDATVVFNITNPNAVAGKTNWGGNKDTCAQGQVGCVQMSQTNIKLNGQLLSDHVNKDHMNNRLASQVFFNFAGATQVNLATDLYATVLAPQADIKANPSVIWGQVIGKSWQGNMQINYDPFNNVGNGTTPTPVPTPATIWIFALALALVYVNRKGLNKKLTNAATQRAKDKLRSDKNSFISRISTN